jgi:phosphoserine phosphatase
MLEKLAVKEGVPLAQVLAIGDGANDIPMMKKAGLGIAFNAKPKVQLLAPNRLNTGSLLDVLYVLGFTKEEQEQLLRD